MRRIDVTESARRDLREIVRYIASESPAGAARLKARIDATIEHLAFMPAAREGRIKGTHEKPVRGLPTLSPSICLIK